MEMRRFLQRREIALVLRADAPERGGGTSKISYKITVWKLYFGN